MEAVMIRVYAKPVDPEAYPDFTRRWARATLKQDLDNEIQFTTLRNFTVENNCIVDIEEKLDL